MPAAPRCADPGQLQLDPRSLTLSLSPWWAVRVGGKRFILLPFASFPIALSSAGRQTLLLQPTVR